MSDYNIHITYQIIFIMTKVLGIVIVVAVLVTSWYLYDTKSVSETVQESTSMSEKQDEILDAMEGADESIVMKKSDVLAGSSSPLLDFTKSSYDEAIASDKLVVLYFYASWCPLCKAEFPKMQSAFDGLTSDQVVGFRVNYNDGDTDLDEKNLARDFGIAYQHTKVFVRKGIQALKSPETWDEARYTDEITKALK
jgi:thiol-disulfide isomerase/thioredoxin